MFKKAKTIVDKADHILIVQGENPDGDSVGSSVALEAIFIDMGKRVTMYCAINVPEYLRYIKGWDRVTDTLPNDFDLTIVVDTASQALLEKAFNPENLGRISKHPMLVIDHHATNSDITTDHLLINDPSYASTGELIFAIASQLDWPIKPDAAESLAISILADTLGLITESTTARTVHTVASLIEKGASLSEIDMRRREFMKKSPRILEYKGILLQRIEYHLDGSLALVHIPWDEIHEYSHEYNPSVLVLDEMRLVTGVRVAIALKTYPDGRLTGKIRCNPDAKIAERIAGTFGGGGHGYSAGFKIYDQNYEQVKTELIGAVDKTLQEYDTTNKPTESC